MDIPQAIVINVLMVTEPMVLRPHKISVTSVVTTVEPKLIVSVAILVARTNIIVTATVFTNVFKVQPLMERVQELWLVHTVVTTTAATKRIVSAPVVVPIINITV